MRNRDNALFRLLDEAAGDDEPSIAEEDASASEAWEEYRRGETTPFERLRHELS